MEPDASNLPKRKLKIRFGVGGAPEEDATKRPKPTLQSESPLFSPEQALRHQRTEALADYLSQTPSGETPVHTKPSEVTMSKIFKAASMQLSDCLKIITSTKGYRTVKINLKLKLKSSLGQGHSWSGGGLLVFRSDGDVFRKHRSLSNRLGDENSTFARTCLRIYSGVRILLVLGRVR